VNVLTVVGARPQIIKAAPVSAELRKRHHEYLLHTGQHYDHALSQDFFSELSIPEPDLNLEIGSGPHGEQTGRMLEGIERVVLDVRPDWVLVYGDTNTTLAAALAAAKIHVPVAHVEAGLRSFDRRMPEEVNRVVTDHLSSLLLCPTDNAAAQLAAEGIASGVVVTGDVMMDAFRIYIGQARSQPQPTVLNRLSLRPGEYVLATLHRAENTDDPTRLRAILDGLNASGCHVVLALHPRTRKAIETFGVETGANVQLEDPVGYLDMLVLESESAAIATDSGGVQKEAYIVGRPCITMRDSTEWPETVDAGWNRLVGANSGAIAASISTFRPDTERPDLFGDGHASERIVAALEKV
jgi:UDP-GlcNAc3NAcA epimerase